MLQWNGANAAAKCAHRKLADSCASACSTIVDAGREWIEAQAADWPMLAAALEDGTVMQSARKTTRNWNRAWEQRVSDLRASPALRHQMGRSHIHRTAIGITRAFVAKVWRQRFALRRALPDRASRAAPCCALQNDTFRTFLSEVRLHAARAVRFHARV